MHGDEASRKAFGHRWPRSRTPSQQCALRTNTHDNFYPSEVLQCFASFDFHHIFPGLSIELWRRVLQSTVTGAPGDLARDWEVL